MMPPDVFVQSQHWNGPLLQTSLHANSHVQLQNPAGYDSNHRDGVQLPLHKSGCLCACVRVCVSESGSDSHADRVAPPSGIPRLLSSGSRPSLREREREDDGSRLASPSQSGSATSVRARGRTSPPLSSKSTVTWNCCLHAAPGSHIGQRGQRAFPAPEVLLGLFAINHGT